MLSGQVLGAGMRSEVELLAGRLHSADLLNVLLGVLEASFVGRGILACFDIQFYSLGLPRFDFCTLRKEAGSGPTPLD